IDMFVILYIDTLLIHATLFPITMLFRSCSALIGISVATGENRASEAAKKAISSPLLETSIDWAHGILMNITGGMNLSLYEVQEAADLVTQSADNEVNVIFGSVINESLKEEIIVTVIDRKSVV